MSIPWYHGSAMAQRRKFLGSVSTATAELAVGVKAGRQGMETYGETKPTRGTFSLDRDRAMFFCPGISERVRILVIADTHLFRDDERGRPFRKYSERMSKAYNQTTHVTTGQPTNPEESFELALASARTEEADLIILLGDTFSFPSEAAIDWVWGKMEATGIPFIYTAGNHDWHYEGMEGSTEDLRKEWTARRLGSLYQGRSPLMQAVEVKGLQIVVLDNSTYEISEDQLAFFRSQAAVGRPLLLAMHIPLYAPGRSVLFGCGHPQWGASSDEGHQTERRPPWPESGHSSCTMNFHREVFSTGSLLGVLAGHVHHHTVDVVQGIPQIIVEHNAAGGQLWVDVLPLP